MGIGERTSASPGGDLGLEHLVDFLQRSSCHLRDKEEYEDQANSACGSVDEANSGTHGIKQIGHGEGHREVQDIGDRPEDHVGLLSKRSVRHFGLDNLHAKP